MKSEFKREEIRKKVENASIKTQLDEWDKQIASLKEERKIRSAALQNWLFKQFKILNYQGDIKTLVDIFATYTTHKIPPGGAGECAGPKLLQFAYLHQLKPIAMAEFWWGSSPKNEIRQAGNFYPSCNEKCKPILAHMLQGLNVAENPLECDNNEMTDLEIVWEDEYITVVNKPAGMLSVPGKQAIFSVYQWAKEKYPLATGPLLVHRLDMDTSGLLVIAKNKEVHKQLQEQFADRAVTKKYIALLDGINIPTEGMIDLPLCCDPSDRPRQMVNEQYGKPALTRYEVLDSSEQITRIAFYPLTGRTHQLRVHAAHSNGLNAPIKGDVLYGKRAERLFLHAEKISFTHPISGEMIILEKKADF